MKLTKLNPLKAHQYNVDEHFISFHTSDTIQFGQKIELDGREYRVKEMIKCQPSRYFDNHQYYEVRV